MIKPSIMKKRFLPLICCILPFLLQAQDQQRFHYGIAINPSAAFALDTDEGETQQLRPSVNLDFNVNYFFLSRWSVSAGLAYANTGRKYDSPYRTESDYNEIGFDPTTDPILSGGGVGEPSPGTGRPYIRSRNITQAYHFLAVPLRVTYHGNAERSWRPYVSAGLAPRLLLLQREEETKYYSDGSTDRSARDYEAEPFHFSLMLSGGVTHDLANGHQVFVGPNLQWVNIQEPQFKGGGVESLLQVGLEVGYLW
jgi:hypothetical protein